jgi:hypothetical protein
MRTTQQAITGASIPPQTSRGAVLVPIWLREQSAESVLLGARTAAARRAPLELVILGSDGATRAECLAQMDEALVVARGTSPGLQVRVHLDAHEFVDWIERLHGQVALMVIGSSDNAFLQSPDRKLDDAERRLRSLPVSRIVIP